jgi:NAD-dependent deacetylase
MRIEDLAPFLTGNNLVFTGAGISVASGLPTFQGAGGLYEGLNPYELASPQAFAKHPVTVWNWYLMRIHEGKGARPNQAHKSLVDLERASNRVTIVTSNVDPLHEMAGSTRVFKLHGNILQTRCTGCSDVQPLELKGLAEQVTDDTLPTCGCGQVLRPNVVWFGERPSLDALSAVEKELPQADAVLEIGHSGTVSYGFTELAVQFGVPVIRINPDAGEQDGVITLVGRAEEILPQLVKPLLASSD